MKKLILLVLLLFIASCGNRHLPDNADTNPYYTESAKKYAETKPNIAGFSLPDKLPQHRRCSNGINTFSTKPVTQEHCDIMAEGISRTIRNSNLNQNSPIFSYLISAPKFKTLSEYNVVLIPPTRFSESEIYKGCPLINYNEISIIGAFLGHYRKSGEPRADFPFLLMPQMNDMENLETYEACKRLHIDGYQNEAEHFILAQDIPFKGGLDKSWSLFYYFTGANDVHNFIRGEDNTGFARESNEAMKYHYKHER